MSTLMHVDHKKDQTGQKETQNVQFVEKRGTGKLILEQACCELKSGILRARPHPAKLPTCGKDMPAGLLLHQQRKASVSQTGTDVIPRGTQVPDQAGSRTPQLQPPGSGLRVKDTGVEGLWSLPPGQM